MPLSIAVLLQKRALRGANASEIMVTTNEPKSVARWRTRYIARRLKKIVFELVIVCWIVRGVWTYEDRI